MKEESTYLYCIVRSRKEPRLTKLPDGVPGTGNVRLLDARDGLRMVVASAPRKKFDAAAIEKGLKDLEWVGECAMAHEAVIERFVPVEALLPAKLFTIFFNDASVHAYVSTERKRLEKTLARVAGRAEWGVRLSFDELAAVRRAERDAAKNARGSSGAAFLLRKKNVRDATREAGTRAREHVERVFDRLGMHAADAVRKPPAPQAFGQRLLLDAAFLVGTDDAAEFRAEAKALAGTLHPLGYRLTVTGPWPPYHFAASEDEARPAASRGTALAPLAKERQASKRKGR